MQCVNIEGTREVVVDVGLVGRPLEEKPSRPSEWKEFQLSVFPPRLSSVCVL